jgi:hypothetical protein
LEHPKLKGFQNEYINPLEEKKAFASHTNVSALRNAWYETAKTSAKPDDNVMVIKNDDVSLQYFLRPSRM